MYSNSSELHSCAAAPLAHGSTSRCHVPIQFNQFDTRYRYERDDETDETDETGCYL